MLFLLPLLAVVAGLEGRLRLAETTQDHKRSLVRVHGPSAESVILGTSNAYFAFNPLLFMRPGLNLAHTSQSLQIDAQIIDRLAADLPRLRVVVLNLSYFSFEYRLYGNQDDYREFQFTHAYNIAGDGGILSWLDLRRYSRLADFGPDQTRRILFAGLGAHLDREINAAGAFRSEHSNYPHLPINATAGRNRAFYHTSTLEPCRTSEALAAIGRVSDLARVHGWKVVLSRAPVAWTYAQALDMDAEARFAANIRVLAQGYGLAFHDYLRDPRFTLADFYDNDHLNENGADKFSRLFDQEILVPLLSDPPAR